MLPKDEFYIGQNVWATIEGQVVTLRSMDSPGRIVFDTGGIGILYRTYEEQRQCVWPAGR